MPADWTFWISLFSALGSALMAGSFFAFSNFVMKALARLPPAHGIRTMQSINTEVLNPLFLGVFVGTAAGSVVLAVVELPQRDSYLLTASCLYLVGCFGVTAACNVPLNQVLAKVDAESIEGASIWRLYLRRWVLWNHVRTAASLGATAAYIIALLKRA
jgi:uncharacterized membrane protein